MLDEYAPVVPLDLSTSLKGSQDGDLIADLESVKGVLSWNRVPRGNSPNNLYPVPEKEAVERWLTKTPRDCTELLKHGSTGFPGKFLQNREFSDLQDRTWMKTVEAY